MGNVWNHLLNNTIKANGMKMSLKQIFQKGKHGIEVHSRETFVMKG